MAALAQPRPRASKSTAVWLLSFLKEELLPYPGRGWTVARMTIAATLMMLWIMVFRIPGGAIGAYFTLLITRESPQATLGSAVRSFAAVASALCLALFSIALFVGDPLLHFFWVICVLFIAFFLLSAMAEYRLALPFCIMLVVTLTYWDFPANTETRVENTLWTALAFAVSFLVTVVLEFVLQPASPHDQVHLSLRHRIAIVESALEAWGSEKEIDSQTRGKLVQYAMVGTARLRRILARTGQNSQLSAELSAIVALIGRLVDLAATVSDVGIAFSGEDRARCLAARNDLEAIDSALTAHDFAALAGLPVHPTDASNQFLQDIQRTIALMPQVVAGLTSVSVYLPSSVDIENRRPFWKENAFRDPEHLHFALKATLAAGSCYILYGALDWSGLNTALTTVTVTAVSTIGSSRQKQLLRVLGALFGAVCLGMASQVFLLPHMTTITDFTLLFVAVTVLSSWIATSSPRLSFAGLQTAFAFYFTQLRTFGPQTSLTVARDDIAGILLGLCAMWLCFDRIWVTDSAARVMKLFIANLRSLSNLSERIECCPDLSEAVNAVRSERNMINNQFDLIRNESDALFFEFGADWQRKVQLRNQIRAWQPQLRTYFLLEISLAQHRLQGPGRRFSDEAEHCIAQSKHILRLLAAWKEAALTETDAQPPAALCELVPSATHPIQVLNCANPDAYTRGIASSMLSITLGLANAMLAAETASLPPECLPEPDTPSR